MMEAFLQRGKISRSSTPSSKNRLETTSEPSAKRIKQEKEPDPNNDLDEKSFDIYSESHTPDTRTDVAVALRADDESSKDRPHISRLPAIESSLPAVKLDEDAIEEYEVFKSSQGDKDANATESAKYRLDTRKWVRGKTSIYVDAFNLALHAVLDEESHLFDKKERMIFGEWDSLGYEAQFLYVLDSGHP